MHRRAKLKTDSTGMLPLWLLGLCLAGIAAAQPGSSLLSAKPSPNTKICQPGYVPSRRGLFCIPCPPGSFSGSGVGSCVPCPRGRTTPAVANWGRGSTGGHNDAIPSPATSAAACSVELLSYKSNKQPFRCECRTLLPSGATTNQTGLVHSAPCSSAAVIDTVSACSTFSMIVSRPPAASDCGSQAAADGGCWVAVAVNAANDFDGGPGIRVQVGWLRSGPSCAGAGATSFLDACPSSKCSHLAVPSCFRAAPRRNAAAVAAGGGDAAVTQQLELRTAPCPAAPAVTRASSGAPVTLQPGDTFTALQVPSSQRSNFGTRVGQLYANLPSLQVSTCSGEAADNVTCWLLAAAKGTTGWLPVARGTFFDAKCRGVDRAPLVEFVSDDCGLAGIQERLACHQITSSIARTVHTTPCSQAAPPGSVGPPASLSSCQRVLLDHSSSLPCSEPSLLPAGLKQSAFCSFVPVYYDLDGTSTFKQGWIIAGCLSAGGKDGRETNFTKPCGAAECAAVAPGCTCAQQQCRFPVLCQRGRCPAAAALPTPAGVPCHGGPPRTGELFRCDGAGRCITHTVASGIENEQGR